jgi:hypothetical protein
MRTPKASQSDHTPSDPRKTSRREGLRPVRIWIPDLDASFLRAEAHRQSLAVATSPNEEQDQAFVDAISDRLSGAE